MDPRWEARLAFEGSSVQDAQSRRPGLERMSAAVISGASA